MLEYDQLAHRSSRRSARAPPAPPPCLFPQTYPHSVCLCFKIDFHTSCRLPDRRRSRGCPAKSHDEGERPNKYPRAVRLPTQPSPPALTPHPLTPRLSPPSFHDDAGLHAKVVLPAPWKEPTDRRCEKFNPIGLPSKSPRQGRARPATATTAAVANARAAATS